jgi:hypothetical protein
MKQLLVLTVLAMVTLAASASAQNEPQQAGLVVAESKLGKDVVNREIVDESTTFAVNDRVFLWMKITGGPSDSVTVTWSIDEYTWQTNLNIGASTWRTWAYKTAWKAGDWKVTVKDAAGDVLLEKTFTVTP